ncbi:helix-turn-helix domain-containing protein [Cohnella sp. GCM10012308]|uniref:helix-turn-helix domain-containing protein n=1 Tax=Cohnella sp. GCM10012308 TaxID=3317329 RepID=UPI00360AB3BE
MVDLFSLGDRIKTERARKKMSQEDLAEELGFKRTNIANYEAGRVTPPSDVIAKLTKIFNVSSDYLLCLDDVGYDVGEAIAEEMKFRGLEVIDLASIVGVFPDYLHDCIENDGPISETILNRIASEFGLSVQSFLEKHSLWDGYINSEFDGDVDKQIAFEKAIEQDAVFERAQPYYELTNKDERDIARKLERMMAGLDSNQAMAFYGEEIELDEDERELLRASMEQTMRLAKQLAKKKFTPKKYRKE